MNLVSVVVVAHNEAARIGFRLRNVLECHPAGSELEIVVVSDGSTDDTVRRANSVGDARIRCLERSSRAGKAACLNAAVAACRGEVVLFADARQRFEPSAVVALIRAFTDPHVGAVSGQLEIEMAVSGAGQGVDAYWRLEKLLRRLEASWDSCVGCTGAIYAIRRCLYQPIEPDTLLDDVVIPMQIAAQGYRVVFESRAIAYDPQSLEPKMEVVRKTRTLAGNFQLLFRHARWLWPWENRLWWQLISHKYLRLATPILLGLALLSNLMLLERPFYVALLGAQLVFYGCAALGFRVRRTMFTAPAGFVFLSWMVVRGFWVYCRKSGGNGWNSSVGPSLSK